MKKLLTLSLPAFLVLLLVSPQSLFAGQLPAHQPTRADIMQPTIDLENLTAEEFLQLSPKGIREATGKKLSLREKIVLRQVQYQVDRQLKRGETVQLDEMYKVADRKFNLGGFLLGLFLGPLGVLIAILFGRDAIRSSLYGLLVLVILGLITAAASA